MRTDGVPSTFFALPTPSPHNLHEILWVSPGSLGEEVVAQAWEEGGLSKLARVSGPWAVVAWDRSAQEHLLITDPIGIQPLFWGRTRRGQIVASSLLSALVDEADVDDALDYEGILIDQSHDLVKGRATAHRTSFASISKVPGGHALRVRHDGSTRLEEYWNPATLPGPDNAMSLRDCSDLLRNSIESAVRRHTAQNLTVGAHVSGGLDCTSVACLAQLVLAESGKHLVAGYSWAPSDEVVPRFPGDERQLLDDVESHAGIPIRTIGPEDSADWFWRLDPVRYPNTDHGRESHVLYQARRDGVRILLSGWGGDEFASFNGRTVIQNLIRRGRLPRAWKERSLAMALEDEGPVPLRRRFRGFAGSTVSTLPDPVRSAIRWRSQTGLRLRAMEIDAAMREFSPVVADLREQNAREFAAAGDYRELQLLLLRYGHLQWRTAGWYQTGRLMGLDYRYPLLDVGVVGAALRMPWWAFRSQGWSRPAFRLAVEKWVPPSVAWNVAKREPALIAPPNGAIDILEVVHRVRHLEDPRYEAVMRLLTMTRDTGAGRLPVHLPVVARPDLAARV